MSPSETVFKLDRLRYADDTPVVRFTTYIPTHLAPDLIKIDFNHASLYDELKQRNLSVTHVTRRLEVKKASPSISQTLKIAENDPVFFIFIVMDMQKRAKNRILNCHLPWRFKLVYY
ncbi:UTRA domain-containing protein [uncultured Lactobacillus sp.]|uniref:UTRA domain-containing protein n=1 Tax=uncultured Lactobacillus sp. TaxID=153152 RepID=UPI0027296A0C|nr:UTRA domain-containing protein [uncultured Lactobacillus sp.]